MPVRLFLDANVLFSAALSPSGAASNLFEFADAGACELAASTFVVAETERNLRAKAPATRERWDHLSAQVIIVPEAGLRMLTRMSVTLPAKDRPVLAAAIACRANVLATGDRRHFGPLFGLMFAGTVVLPPRQAVAFMVELVRSQ